MSPAKSRPRSPKTSLPRDGASAEPAASARRRRRHDRCLAPAPAAKASSLATPPAQTGSAKGRRRVGAGEPHERTVESPIGRLRLTVVDDRLTAVTMDADDGPPLRGRHPVLAAAAQQLEEYFAGRRTRFELPLAITGTPFQRAVREALCRIRFGETASYGEIAARVGRPKAVRAVGRANATNPLAIVVPCHRVVGANGSLTGYGGGLPRKAWLLDHEMSVACEPPGSV